MAEPNAGTFVVACKESGDVPSGGSDGVRHIVIRRLRDRAVLLDRELPAGSNSAIVVRQSGVVILPLYYASYGPVYLGPCTT